VKKRQAPEPRQYFRHTGSPAWGTAVLVKEQYDQRTYLFTDGAARTFKTALVANFIQPADEPGPEDRVRLERGITSVAAAGAAAATALTRKDTATPKAVHLEIEGQIRAARGDDGPFLVYADWLQTKGDPRGQLIITQHQLAQDPGNKKLRATERALFAEHGNYFLPPSLAKVLAGQRKRDAAPPTELVWRCGFIDRIRLARRSPRTPELEPILAELLAHPSAQFARSITFGAVGAPDDHSYISLLATVTRARPALLEELEIGDAAADQEAIAFTRAGDLSQLVNALPDLRRLAVRTGSLRFSTQLKHPHLRELALVTSELSAVNLAKVVKLAMPSLVAFELEVNGLTLRPADLATLLANKSFASLKKLALRRTAATATLLEAIIKAPLTAGLDELDLSDGDLGDPAAIQITHYAARLGHLKRLVLDGNRISPPALSRIASAVDNVSAEARETRAIQAVIDRAPDAASMTAARELAHPADWLAIGRDGDRIWGEYEGRDHYWVYARTADNDAGCSCPSPKHPCKHALALLLLATTKHVFPDRPAPSALLRHARSERTRYRSGWE
jgi:uncharacterized protein (TIGR02996 family)